MIPQYREVAPYHTPHIVVVTTVSGLHEVLDDHKLPINDPRDQCIGWVRDLDGDRCLVFISTKDIDNMIELVSVITHEAVHVSQHFFNRIAEHHPSDEFQAYTIEDITRAILKAIYAGDPQYMTGLVVSTNDTTPVENNCIDPTVLGEDCGCEDRRAVQWSPVYGDRINTIREILKD